MNDTQLQQWFGGLGGLAGAGLGLTNLQNNYGVLQNALGTIGPTQLAGYNMGGPGGMSSSYNPSTGGANIDLGGLNPAFSGFAGAAGAGANNYNPAVLNGLMTNANGMLPGATSNLTNAYAGNNAFQAAAGTQASTLGNTYGQIYGNTLSSLQAQQQPQVQQQAFGLQNTLFGNGTLGSTGATSGALAAGNFGSQVNAMNAQDSLTAQQQALSGMQGQANIASTLSGTGNQLLTNAFNNFGNTNQLISGLNTAQLGNAATAAQGAGALNTIGLNNYNSALQTGMAQATAKNQSLFPYAQVATSLANQPNAMSGAAGLLSGMGSSLLGTGGLSGLLSGIFGTGAGAASGAASGLSQFLNSGSGLSQLFGNSSGSPIGTMFNQSGLSSSLGNGFGALNNSNYLFNQPGYDPTTGFNTGTSNPISDMNMFGGSTDTSGLNTGAFGATDFSSFNGAGGQAATSPVGLNFANPDPTLGGLADNQSISLGASPALSGSASSPSLFGSLGSGLSNVGAAFGILNGLRSGSPIGEASAGLGAAALANRNGLFGAPSSTFNAGLAAAGGVLGMYQGLQQGGIGGYGNAAASALRTGAGVASMAGDNALAGSLGSAAGAVAIPLAAYNFAKSYQSGNTASDAANGLETGASIGSYAGPFGAVVGGVIGGAVGALSSAFGGGMKDQETVAGNQLDKAAASGQVNANQVLASPQNAFGYLAGAFDAKNNSAGHSQPLEQAFGRGGEGAFTNSMFSQINSAITSGKLPPTATPQQIYSQVVEPWLASKNASIDTNSVDSAGVNQGHQLIASIQSLIGNWQSGNLNGTVPIGAQNQMDSSMPTFAGLSATDPTMAYSQSLAAKWNAANGNPATNTQAQNTALYQQYA